jgi:trehalose/maltose hydrolase-like predicted phosphorylase
MMAAGVEILVETARFWASRAQVEHGGHAHIREVIGPDEYHELVDDNAYTNVMAAFNLERAADAIAMLDCKQPSEIQRLSARLGLMKKEAKGWLELAGALVTGFDPATNLFEQFAGYSQLEEIDPIELQACTPVDLCLGAERIGRSKIIKQADVVALSALLWEKWPVAVHATNFRYYEPRTAHGSSLSPALHALVAARLGDRALAQAYFRQAARSIWPTTWAMRLTACIWAHLVVCGRPRCSASLALSYARTASPSIRICFRAGPKWRFRCNGGNGWCVCALKLIRCCSSRQR